MGRAEKHPSSGIDRYGSFWIPDGHLVAHFPGTWEGIFPDGVNMNSAITNLTNRLNTQQ